MVYAFDTFGYSKRLRDGGVSCCRFYGHQVKVDDGTGGRQWDADGLNGHSSSRR
jgi:hypothetical protein